MKHPEKAPARQRTGRPAAERASTQGTDTALADARSGASAQHELDGVIGASPRVLARHALIDALANSPRMVAQRRLVQAAAGSGNDTGRDQHGETRGAGIRSKLRLATAAWGEAGTSMPHSPAGDRVMQRFPATVATAPIDWAAAPFVAAPLGGGVTAVIFKLTQPPPLQPGEVGTVIVKALKVEEPGQVTFGEAFLRQMGFATPDDRLIMPQTPEFTQLAGLLHFPTDNHGQFVAGGDSIGALFVMEDLGASGASTIVSQVMNATTRADIDDVFDTLTDPVVLQTVARATVCDTAIGNWDRITMDRQNFGNLMIRRGGAAATQVFLIDTNARLPPIRDEIVARAQSQGGFYEGSDHTVLLKYLFDHRDWAVGNWVEAIPTVIATHQGLRTAAGGARNAFLDQEQAYIAQRVALALPIVQAAFTLGIRQEIASLLAMMSNKADPNRQAIKAAAAAAAGQSFKTLKAQVGYLGQRERPPGAALGQGDIGHTGAASIVETYGRYRVLKGVAALPVSAAQAPAAHAALVVPPSLRASTAGQVFKGRPFKAIQAGDFAAFNPQYVQFRSDIDNHIAYLESLSPLADNLLKLATSTAEPGSTCNQRAMASLHKRQQQITRLRVPLKLAATTGVQWAANYLVKADQLLAALQRVNDRYANLRNIGAELQQQRDRLQTAADGLDLHKARL